MHLWKASEIRVNDSFCLPWIFYIKLLTQHFWLNIIHPIFHPTFLASQLWESATQSVTPSLPILVSEEWIPSCIISINDIWIYCAYCAQQNQHGYIWCLNCIQTIKWSLVYNSFYSQIWSLWNRPENGRCMSGVWEVTVSSPCFDTVNTSKNHKYTRHQRPNKS